MLKSNLKRIISFFIATMLLLALTGCGNTAPSGTTAPSSGGSKSPQKTSLSIRIPDSFTMLDPHKWTVASDFMLCAQIYEPLYRMDSNLKEIPVLASSYTHSDDGLSYVFKLVDNAYFSNGDKMTASDVKFSFERAKASSYVSKNISTIKSVAADDANNKVTLTLSAPTPGLITGLSKILIASQKFVTENQDAKGMLGFKACGTGPYMVKTYTAEDSVTLESNPKYRSGEASIKTLVFHLITDENTAVTAFQAGDLDAGKFTTSNWDTIKSNPKFKTAELPANHVTYIIINTKKPPFDNKLVRQAIAYAVNRDDIIKMAMNGKASPTYTVGTPFMVGYSKTEPKFTYNPAKAKELLAQAGYPNGLDIGEISAISASYFKDVFEVVQQELAAVGITCKVSAVEGTTLTTNCMNGNFSMATMGQNNTYDMSKLSAYYGSEFIGSTNMAQYSNPKIDAMLKDAASNLDPTKRSALYKSIAETADDDCAYIPLFNINKCFAWSSNLNYTPDQDCDLFYNCSWK